MSLSRLLRSPFKKENLYKTAYVIIAVVFLFWMLFLDSHSWLTHKELNEEIEKLEARKKTIITTTFKLRKFYYETKKFYGFYFHHTLPPSGLFKEQPVKKVIRCKIEKPDSFRMRMFNKHYIKGALCRYYSDDDEYLLTFDEKVHKEFNDHPF